MESEMTPVQPPQKPFYKRPWGFIALVAATPVVVVALVFAYIVGSYYLNYFIDASKLPPEARWLLEHMSERQRIEDMVENAGKYRKLPCAEVQILEDTCCFDQSRMGNMSIYTYQQSGKFEAFKFSFISEILPTNKTGIGYEHAISWISLHKANSDYDVTGENGSHCPAHTALFIILLSVFVKTKRNGKNTRKPIGNCCRIITTNWSISPLFRDLNSDLYITMSGYLSKATYRLPS